MNSLPLTVTPLVGHVIFAVVFLLGIVGPTHPLLYHGNTVLGLLLFVLFASWSSLGPGTADPAVLLTVMALSVGLALGLRHLGGRGLKIPRGGFRARIQRLRKSGGWKKAVELLLQVVVEQAIWRATYQGALLGGGLYAALHVNLIFPFSYFQLYVRVKPGGKTGLATGLLFEATLVSVLAGLLFLWTGSIWPGVAFQLAHGVRTRPRLYNRGRAVSRA